MAAGCNKINFFKQVLDFKNKKVTVMGLGLYQDGSGISATRFLVSAGAKVTVTDLKTAEDLAPQLKRLGKLVDKVELVLGRHRDKDFKNADLIVKNPDVRSTSKFLKMARSKNIPIETDISLFFQLAGRSRIVGITGTRGKSTTTTLIYELIKSIDKQAILGGNITKSPLAQMKQAQKGGQAVLELSSWMLESLEPHQISPHVAVFTNIYPDHLNTYTGMADYVSAKENICRWQNPQDYLIINRDNKYTNRIGSRVLAQRFWFSLKEFKNENGCFVRKNKLIFRRDGVEASVLSLSDIKIPGRHNLENVLAAVCTGMIFGVGLTKIKKIVGSFKGVPNRLELLRYFSGRKYYNDTTSTTPEATLAALSALGAKGGKKNIVLIAGGSDKGLDFKMLTKKMVAKCRAIVFLSGTGTDRLLKFFKNKKTPPWAVADSLVEAVGIARSFSKNGDVILLSPACSSFGMFKNEFDRGDQFRNIVASLK